MNHIDFFKLQAKRLKNDFNTKKRIYDETGNGYLLEFTPKYFDVENIEVTYDLSNKEIESFSLMKSQHFIAQLVGFRKWNDLINSDPDELELAKLLFENQHKLSIDDWEGYITEAEISNDTSFCSEGRLEIFKMTFLVDADFATSPNDFRLN